MNAWIIKIGEPLPLDPGEGRLYRSGLLAARLRAAGHDVVWWTSTFDHAGKRYRSAAPCDVAVSEGYRIVQLHGAPYRRNVSLARVRNHRQIARAFAREAPRRPAPDVIVCAYPTIELSREAVRYGEAHGVPVLLDIRDLWPDIFLDVLPAALRPIGRLALRPMEREKRLAFRGATAILGTSEAFVDWGVAAAGRPRGGADRAFPHGYPTAPIGDDERRNAESFWRAQFHGDFPRNVICFFGNFAEHVLDLTTVIAAARQMGEDAAFVLCGSGPSRDAMLTLAAGLPHVYLPGRVGQAEIRVLMEKSRLGLVPYTPRWDFDVAIPNKAIEYLSAGLPVVTCLEGELRKTIEREGCGAWYRAGDAGALAALLGRLLHDDTARTRMSASARALFASRFDADRVYGDYVTLIEQAAARGMH